MKPQDPGTPADDCRVSPPWDAQTELGITFFRISIDGTDEPSWDDTAEQIARVQTGLPVSDFDWATRVLDYGERPTIDFRFEAPLAADNICDRLTPGDGTGSQLYIRDATRGAGQMPPLATDVPDSYQLGITDAWIDTIGTCPH